MQVFFKWKVHLWSRLSSSSTFGYDHSQTVMFSKIGHARSSAVPQSLVLRVVSSGWKCCRLVIMGQVCRICSGIWSLSPHLQTAVGCSPKYMFWWSLQCPVQSLYKYWDLVFSPRLVVAVSHLLVSISCVSPLDSLFCLEDCFVFAEGRTGSGLLHSLPLPDDLFVRCLVLQHGQGSTARLLDQTLMCGNVLVGPLRYLYLVTFKLHLFCSWLHLPPKIL
jgi:hypothetical protein